MTALLGLVPVAVAALGWYGLHRLNRRKHWFRIRTTDGGEMKVYFERQGRSGRKHKTQGPADEQD